MDRRMHGVIFGGAGELVQRFRILIVSKRLGSPYRAGPRGQWLKMKTACTGRPP